MPQPNGSPQMNRLRFLNSSIRPTMVLLSATLGLYTGILPGFSGLQFIAIVLFLFLNLNISVFLISCLLGIASEFIGASLFYHIGLTITQDHPDILTTLKTIPLVALGDYNRYCFTGTVMAGLLPAISWGIFASFITSKMRCAAEKNLDKPGTLITFANICIAGKTIVTPDHLAGAKKQLLRNGFIVLSAFLIITTLLLVRYQAGNILVPIVGGHLGQLNKAQVDINKITIFPIKGKIEINHIAVTDNTKPSHNAIYVKQLHSNLNRFALLYGQIVLDEIIVNDVSFNTQRETAGEVYQQQSEDKSQNLDYSSLHTKGETLLNDYLEEPEKFHQFIETIKTYLPEKKSAAQNATESVAATEKAKSNSDPLIVGYRNARRYATANAPTIIVRHIALEQVNVPLALIGNATILANNISDHPEVYPHPMIVSAKSNEHDITLSLNTIFQQQQFETTIKGELVDIDLKHIQTMLANSNNIIFKQGSLNGHISGSITKDTIDIQLTLQLSQMEASSGKNGILQLDKTTSNRVLEVLDTLDVIINITGAIDSPTITFNNEALEKQFNKALEKAGKKAVEREINKEVDKAIDKVTSKGNKYQKIIDRLNDKKNRGEKLSKKEKKALKRAKEKLKKKQLEGELIDSAIKGLEELFKK